MFIEVRQNHKVQNNEVRLYKTTSPTNSSSFYSKAEVVLSESGQETLPQEHVEDKMEAPVEKEVIPSEKTGEDTTQNDVESLEKVPPLGMDVFYSIEVHRHK
jgi:hypothetical protein